MKLVDCREYAFRVPPHEHICETEEGASAVSGVPFGTSQEKARKSFPSSKVSRFVWERFMTLRENCGKKSISSLQRFGKCKNFDLALLGYLSLTQCVSFRDYLILQMDRCSSRRIPESYVTHWRRHRIRELVNCEECELYLHNKLLTKRILAQFGIPQTRALVYIDKGNSFDVESMQPLGGIEAAAKLLLNTPFIVKGVTGSRGEQNFIYPSSDYDFDSCIEAILCALRSFNSSIMVEELVRGDLTPFRLADSLNTVRVTTWRNAAGKIKVIGAAQRLAVREGCGDNWADGGLAAEIDIDSGTVNGDFYSNILRPHPDFSLKQSFEVPQWDSVKSLACQAHSIFHGMSSIGWDIANVSPQPLIIEGNHDWGLYIHQRTSGKGFDLN